MTNKKIRTELSKIEATLDRLEKLVFKKVRGKSLLRQKAKAGKVKTSMRS